MGLIKAAAGAIGGVMADQWKDFFSCESLDEETLVVKGKKQSSGRSSNKHGEDNVITDGSGIVVSDGQCHRTGNGAGHVHVQQSAHTVCFYR